MTISKKNMKWIPWLLILPVVLIRGFTTVYPILMTVKNSFFNISILAGINEFIGFKNYLKVFSDPKVLTSISFTAIFVVASMIFHVILRSYPGTDPEYEIQRPPFSEDHRADPVGYACSSSRYGCKMGI